MVKSEGIWGGGTKDANRTTSKWKFDYQDEERSRYKGGGGKLWLEGKMTTNAINTLKMVQTSIKIRISYW